MSRHEKHHSIFIQAHCRYRHQQPLGCIMSVPHIVYLWYFPLTQLDHIVQITYGLHATFCEWTSLNACLGFSKKKKKNQPTLSWLKTQFNMHTDTFVHVLYEFCMKSIFRSSSGNTLPTAGTDHSKIAYYIVFWTMFQTTLQMVKVNTTVMTEVEVLFHRRCSYCLFVGYTEYVGILLKTRLT